MRVGSPVVCMSMQWIGVLVALAVFRDRARSILIADIEMESLLMLKRSMEQFKVLVRIRFICFTYIDGSVENYRNPIKLYRCTPYV